MLRDMSDMPDGGPVCHAEIYRGTKNTLISYFGLLRLALMFLGLAMVFLVPDPGAELVLEWPGVLFTLVAPVFAPLFF